MFFQWMRVWVPIFAFICCLFNFGVENFVAAYSEQARVVRVGYFAYAGYHNIDKSGAKSGYGYEVLQKLKRYGNWKYEYVGYDKTWNQMLEMLEKGEIDMLSSAIMTDERLQRFDYSNTSVGVSASMLTVRKSDSRYEPGDYAAYSGMRVGIVQRSERYDDIVKFARENGFYFTPVFYKNMQELQAALHESKEVDAILTNSLRKFPQEKLLNEIAPRPNFIIVKKGNTELLSEINHALVRLNMDDPQWNTRLRLKYYKLEETKALNLTFDDKEFIAHVNGNNETLKVLVDTQKRPYAYNDKDGQVRGIVVDLFDMMAQKLGMKYEFLPVNSTADYQKAFHSGAADIILDGRVSLQETESLNYHNVGTYMNTPLALYYKREHAGEAIRKVATVGDLEAQTQDYFDGNAEIVLRDNAQECLDLLEHGIVDAIFIRSLCASDFLLNDYRNQYMTLVVPEQIVPISLLVKASDYALAPSVFAKACATITNKDVELVSLKYKDMVKPEMDLKTIIYMNPVFFVGIAVVIIILSFLVLSLQEKRQRDIAKKNEDLEEANAFLAERDVLTCGYNRQGLINAMTELRHKVNLQDYAILFIDIKNIKAINEMFGVEQGDEVLKMLYKNLKESSLQPTVLARTESDHFVVLVERKHLDYQELKKVLVMTKNIKNRDMKVFCRCGIYEIVDEHMDLMKMVNNARLARRYMGNDYHESYIVYNSSMSDDYVDRAEVLSSYEGALANNEFKVYYQPIVHTATGRIASAEALIRWIKPDKKIVSPGLFVPVLEKNGLISKLDSFMENAVYNFLLQRQKQGLFRVPVSVNLSWMDFYDDQLVASIMKKARTGELDKKSVRYEITETAYSELETNNSQLLSQLREYGVDIVLDDFGSGYSSLGMLQDYHFAILKLDMSFIRKLEANFKVQLIVQSVIDMCHRLQIKVVAEGVEHEREVQILREMKCDYIQGYYFSKPLSEEEFVAYLEKESKLVE